MTTFSAPGRMPAGSAARFGRAGSGGGQPAWATGAAVGAPTALLVLGELCAPAVVTARTPPAATAPAATTAARAASPLR